MTKKYDRIRKLAEELHTQRCNIQLAINNMRVGLLRLTTLLGELDDGSACGGACSSEGSEGS